MGLSKGFKSTVKKSNNVRVEEGTYPCRIVQVIDMGVQETEWKGETKRQQKVLITFEFPTERVTVDGDDRPRWLSKEYTVSDHEKSALYALLMAADPDGKVTMKGRNVSKLLGLPVMVTVGSTETGNAKVTAVARLMKGLTVGELENDPSFFDLDAPDKAIFDKLPKWLQERIELGIGYDGSWMNGGRRWFSRPRQWARAGGQWGSLDRPGP